jgi:eukaryotic-like serine/threonine-protein kinase
MSHSEHPLDNKLLLGRYRVMRLLGEGGMGTVHLGRVEGAEGFTRPVVVKRMKRDIRVSDEGHRLFIREAKILSKLQHPSIVGIVDFGVEDGAHIMVLEYVHGYTLSPWIDYRHRNARPLPVDICLFIVRRILDALHYAHHFSTNEGEIEIVHRDVSPDNVLLSNKGYVHLLDFGIASMRGPHGEGATKSGAFRGKLCYAAPETVKAEPATPRSDQYSAAVLLLEILTGKTPFETESIAETFVRMVNEIPPPASKFRDDIPAGLDQVLARALAKDPNERFASAQAFARELRRFQADDEEVAEQLKEMIREDFERLPDDVGVEALKDRESALEKILSHAPGPIAKKTTGSGRGGPNSDPLPATIFDGNAPQTVIRVDTPANAVTSALSHTPTANTQTGQLQ